MKDEGQAPTDKKRIALALPSLLPFGGVETIWIMLAKKFLCLGYSVDFVLANEPKNLDHTIPKGARIFEFSSKRLRAFVPSFVGYLRSENPQVILTAMWPFTSLCIIGKILAGSSARIIVSDHNMLLQQYAGCGFFHHVFMRASLATYRLADSRVAVSAGVADDVCKLSGIARDKFDVIHNPMPLVIDEATGMSDAEMAWDGWKGLRVITVGRLKDQKNHLMLIKAFRKLLEGTNARLMILGTGERESKTRAAIETEGLSGKVLMPGHVVDPVPFYRSANLFVLSSDYEGFGNVIIEALACGLPVVSTDCPSGPAEILKNGRFGHLTSVGDADALAEAMHDALTGDHDIEMLKRRAQDFTPEIVAKKYLKLLFPDESCT